MLLRMTVGFPLDWSVSASYSLPTLSLSDQLFLFLSLSLSLKYIHIYIYIYDRLEVELNRIVGEAREFEHNSESFPRHAMIHITYIIYTGIYIYSV